MSFDEMKSALHDGPLPSAADLDACAQEREQMRRERLATLLETSIPLPDGSCVQWYGNGDGFFCVMCAHASNEREHVYHPGNCQVEYDYVRQLAAYLETRCGFSRRRIADLIRRPGDRGRFL